VSAEPSTVQPNTIRSRLEKRHRKGWGRQVKGSRRSEAGVSKASQKSLRQFPTQPGADWRNGKEEERKRMGRAWGPHTHTLTCTLYTSSRPAFGTRSGA
jgi:hypothetical protein